MAIYALIGGRSINNLTNPSLEKKIISLINKEKVNIVYFPQASLDNMEKSFQKFSCLMAETSFEIKCCYNIEDKKYLIDLLNWSDLLYFGGGHADDLIKVVNNSPLYQLLINYQKMIIGVSAGAIMLSAYGMGDRNVYVNAYQMYNYQMVKGLNLCHVTCCPHYDHNGLWCYNDVVKKYDYDGYAIEDDTAVVFDNDKCLIFKEDKSKSVYRFSKDENYKMKALY